MIRKMVPAAFALLLALPLPQTAQAAIPLFNGTCPGGVAVHADEGGPVYVNGREARVQRISDDYFEARDAREGITLSIMRSTDGELNVSYTERSGSNGICSIANRHSEPGPVGRGIAGAAGEVSCEAAIRRQAECAMDTRGDVQLVRQLGRARCVQNENWGLYRHAVWVKDGCHAVFRNLSRDSASVGRRSSSAVEGSVLLDACDTRANADGRLVTRVPVNDDVTELIVDYPEGRFLCMVRNDGLVQSLTRLRKR
ncbi:DUF3011 domain-containing protein [Luteimonas sp. RIT-PG2_3]